LRLLDSKIIQISLVPFAKLFWEETTKTKLKLLLLDIEIIKNINNVQSDFLKLLKMKFFI